MLCNLRASVVNLDFLAVLQRAYLVNGQSSLVTPPGGYNEDEDDEEYSDFENDDAVVDDDDDESEADVGAAGDVRSSPRELRCRCVGVLDHGNVVLDVATGAPIGS